MDFYLGIDIGTSRVKAVLFDQHFTARASAAENTSPRLSANGYAEQDMTQLWHSVPVSYTHLAAAQALISAPEPLRINMPPSLSSACRNGRKSAGVTRCEVPTPITPRCV